MLDNAPRKDAEDTPSSYWQEELAGFEYLFDASPLIIKKLRHHAYHITGAREYDYRKHHARETPTLERRLRRLQSTDRHDLLVPESPELGGFGYLIGGALYNVDTLRFYECLLTLDSQSLLDQFRNGSGPKTVLEIGSGWGGLAYQFKKLFPKTCYILIDFPASLLLAATYLKTTFPNSKTLLVDGSENSYHRIDPQAYDFIFIPHYGWSRLAFQRPDLLINMASFQEMTTPQVEFYLRKAKEWGIPSIYSWNRDHSPNNPELTYVSSIMEKHYKIRTANLFTAPKANPRFYTKKILGFIFPKRFSDKRDPTHAYKHLIGTL